MKRATSACSTAKGWRRSRLKHCQSSLRSTFSTQRLKSKPYRPSKALSSFTLSGTSACSASLPGLGSGYGSDIDGGRPTSALSTARRFRGGDELRRLCGCLDSERRASSFMVCAFSGVLKPRDGEEQDSPGSPEVEERRDCAISIQVLVREPLSFSSVSPPKVLRRLESMKPRRPAGAVGAVGAAACLSGGATNCSAGRVGGALLKTSQCCQLLGTAGLLLLRRFCFSQPLSASLITSPEKW
mmetsp:Transcript_117968/g.280025  ORF Transcript_117968/g.280025 Transcript_117968/m.280025 type:complete len:242 (-) Transcript_117968:265-990(-)